LNGGRGQFHDNSVRSQNCFKSRAKREDQGRVGAAGVPTLALKIGSISVARLTSLEPPRGGYEPKGAATTCVEVCHGTRSGGTHRALTRILQ